MNTVFADTFYWIALTSKHDSAHQTVMKYTASLKPRSIITSDEVLTEFLAYCASDELLRGVAGNAVRSLINNPDIRIIPQSRTTFLGAMSDGLTLYNACPDKGYSLTHCISRQTMRREGLTDVLTNDRHFEREGFRAVSHLT